MELSERQLEALHSAVELQDAHLTDEMWDGFLWHEVHAPAATLNTLVSLGYLDVSYQSRSHTLYKVSDMPKAKKVLDAYNRGESLEEPDSEIPLIVPHDLFDIIVRHDQTKNLIKMAISANEPVHCLLVGEPATAKSLFLTELSRIPGSRLALGGTSSRAGIVDFLIEARPRFLIIDEIDKADQKDMDVILSLMEGGLVTRLKKGMREQVRMRTWVFAGANRDRYLSEALKSRFVIRHFDRYTEQDFCDISFAILTKRERIIPDLALDIINKLKSKTCNPRDAVKVARLMQDPSKLTEIIDTIWN